MPDGDANFYVDPPGKLGYETYIVRDLVTWIDRRYKTIATREGRAIAGMSMGGYGALALAMRHTETFSAVASHSGIAALLYKGPYPYDKERVELYTDVRDLSGWYGKLGTHGDRLRDLFGTELARWRDYDPVALADKLRPGRLAIYLDCGSEDAFHLDAGMQLLHDRLLARGIDHAYYYGPGGHDIAFWKERLPRSLEFLRAHVAKPVQASR
jgi:S-formylglutathione hydrolase